MADGGWRMADKKLRMISQGFYKLQNIPTNNSGTLPLNQSYVLNTSALSSKKKLTVAVIKYSNIQNDKLSQNECYLMTPDLCKGIRYHV